MPDLVDEYCRLFMAKVDRNSEERMSKVKNSSIDWLIFVGSVLTIVLLCIPLAVNPEAGKQFMEGAFDYLTSNFGFLYVLSAIGVFGFLLYLAFGRHGNISFGDSEPEFSLFSWCAMLFCGGIGTSVLYWGTVEWAHYYQAPPYGIEAESSDALIWSISYPMFHWGLLGWGFYCLPGIAAGLAFYRGGAKSLRLSEACAPVIGNLSQGLLGRLIDFLYLVGLIGAVSTGLGLAVPLLAELIAELFGLNRRDIGFGLDIFVIMVISLLFCASVWVGLEKGVKRLSNINVYFAFFVLAFVFLVGPTLFIIEMGISSFGHLFQNFLKMSTWLDPMRKSDFVESWTIFYWAWWVALGPYMGIFIARISKGRTLKQIILGCLIYGTLGCTLFFMVFGNYSAYLELNGIVSVLSILNEDGAPMAIVQVLKSLPLASLVLIAFTLLCIIFAATSFDSASYTLAMVATKELGHDEHPAKWHRMFWACLISILPITLIYLGGLKPLQSAVTLASIPLLVIFGVMVWGLKINLAKIESNTLSEGQPK